MAENIFKSKKKIFFFTLNFYKFATFYGIFYVVLFFIVLIIQYTDLTYKCEKYTGLMKLKRFTDKRSNDTELNDNGSSDKGSNDKGSNDKGSNDKGSKVRQRVKRQKVKMIKIFFI